MQMSEVSFDGRVALVTGAGGGIGRCHALLLERRGAKVVVNDLGARSTDGKGAGTSMADLVVQEIEAEGGIAVANYDSVSTPEGGNAMVEAALKTYGRLDIVVNNAGILRDRSFTKLAIQDIQDVLDVHLRHVHAHRCPSRTQNCLCGLLLHDDLFQPLQFIFAELALVLDVRDAASVDEHVGHDLQELGEVPRVPLAHPHGKGVDVLIQLIQQADGLDDHII